MQRFNELRERLLRAGVAPRHVRRYLAELNEHLSDLIAEETSAGRNPEDAQASALSRLGATDQLASAMIDRREFQSWSAKTPWAVFGLAPIILLAASYFAACFYLWCGWNLFLPVANTPFGRTGGSVYGLSNLYFQAGKLFYFSAPVLIGWAVAATAARQRLKIWWPAIALALLASMGATAHIQANRVAFEGGLGHIKMTFFGFGGTSLSAFNGAYGFVLFTLSILPYLVWRIRRRAPA